MRSISTSSSRRTSRSSRGSVLEARSALDRVKIVRRAVERSIRNLEGGGTW